MALQSFRLSNVVLPLETIMEASPVQLKKASRPIEVTEFGMVTEVSPVQFQNAASPIEMTELGKVTEVNPVQK